MGKWRGIFKYRHVQLLGKCQMDISAIFPKSAILFDFCGLVGQFGIVFRLANGLFGMVIVVIHTFFYGHERGTWFFRRKKNGF